MELKEFADQIAVVQQAILDEYTARPLTEEPPAPPRNFEELIASVRAVAEDLILLADVNEAIARLRQDPARLLNVVALTTEISREDYMLAARRAYEATLHEPTILPFHAYCSFLIELCSGLEVVRKNSGPKQ